MEGVLDHHLHAFAILFDDLDDLEDAFVVEARTQYVERPLIPDVQFDFATYLDVDALSDFRYTCDELKRLAVVMKIPNVFISGARDRVLGVEALAMLCYRISYPGKLSRTHCYLDGQWEDTLFFDDGLYAARHQQYVQAVTEKTNGLVQKISMFTDGTKGFICRPGKRKQHLRAMQAALDCISVGDKENLQKVCYSGHKRHHCLNYQGVCTPDGTAVSGFGLMISFYGPIEGRLHDSTMLRESGLLPSLSSNESVKDLSVLIHGDPAYGINDLLCSPFRNAHVTSAEKRFNTGFRSSGCSELLSKSGRFSIGIRNTRFY